ncbi:MAG: PD-(D/E)XK nuclease family protein, partial [Chthoniobacter sp.]
DRKLFAGQKGLQSKSQAKLLLCGSGEANADAFEHLPSTPDACSQTAQSQADKAVMRSQEAVLSLTQLPAKILPRSRERAAVFLKRNPSALAEAALAETDPAAQLNPIPQAPAGPNAGQLYGTWWHGFVEHLDWTARPADWEATFQTHLAHSPDTERSRREWTLLLQQLSNGSELARLLVGPGTLAHAEMPFLWAMSDRECLDGIIDLAIYDRTADRWTILDWKTNRDRPSHTHYRPQLSAYWKAAAEMLQRPIAAGLYITKTGEWVPYETAELSSTWEALKNNSAALTEALEDDRAD